MNNVFIISGPAGSGKDAIIEGLKEALSCERIITSTTRAMRPGEKEGVDYYFLPRPEFERKMASGEFLEHSVNENGELYGVTKKELERASKLPAPALWKPDWKGVVSAKAIFPDICAIFISAPVEVLEARLRKRDQANQDERYFTERMAYTREWLKHTDIYDYTIENRDGELEKAIEEVKSLIQQKLAPKA